MCKDQHELLIICRDGPEMEQKVVRWCINCGAVVVDIDVDGRIAPGLFMRMKFPKIAMEEAHAQRNS